MSERIAEVIPVNLIKHPNADSLSINEYGGYTSVLRTEDWQGITQGVFIEPDTIVDASRPEFTFLDPNGGKVRIKAKRLRQVWSMGLLIPAPQGAKLGDNLYEQLGLEHYEPEMEHISTGGNWAKTPSNWQGVTKYDIDNGRSNKYANLFTPGEMISATHKLNGSNIGVVFSDGELHVKSRSGFRTKEDNIFWRCVTPEMEKFCMENPDFMLYGEAYGQVKGFKYDCQNGEVRFRCFDILQPNRQYVCVKRWHELCDKYNILKVPAVGSGTMPFNYEQLLELCQSKCPLGNPINEGIVCRPLIERRDYRLGRVIIKLINPSYLEKS